MDIKVNKWKISKVLGENNRNVIGGITERKIKLLLSEANVAGGTSYTGVAMGGHLYGVLGNVIMWADFLELEVKVGDVKI